MTESSQAVFLSYASQDAEAAQRICQALRAAGVEVWFDQSELRGGDAWDRKIHEQIRDCRLFIPVISANTEARDEGYFRREWAAAVDRMRDMAEHKAFLLPVVIDATEERHAAVPQRFRLVQWMNLAGGEPTPAFVNRVAALLGQAAPTPRADATAAVAPAFARPGAVRRPWVAMCALAAAIALSGAWLAWRHLRLHALPVPASASEKSIAVLPFADMSEKHDQEYFADGIAEELLDQLAQVPELRVPSRTSSFYFKGKQSTILQIAEALGVSYVLEGSVRKSGDTLRVTVQLIRADSGYQLWSKTFDRELKDVFKVQDEVAGAVVDALKVKLALRQSASHGTSNIEAYNEFLLGRQFENSLDLDSLKLAGDAYRKAIALDPNYGAAYARLANSESEVANWSGDAAGMQKAEADADKAVALAPEQAIGYALRGRARAFFGWNWAGAESDLAKARALDPANGDVEVSYAWLSVSVGRLADAVEAARKATELDPLSPRAWSSLGYALLVSRDFSAAATALRRALEISPGEPFALYVLGSLQLREGQAADALATFSKVKLDVLRLAGIANAEHALGHSEQSQQAFAKLVLIPAQISAYEIALVYLSRGDKDTAFEWLERAYQQHCNGLPYMKADLRLSGVHEDPRYLALLRKMNLPE